MDSIYFFSDRINRINWFLIRKVANRLRLKLEYGREKINK